MVVWGGTADNFFRDAGLCRVGGGNSGTCPPFLTTPVAGDALDCRRGAGPPTITWDPGQYDKFRVSISWAASFSSKQRVTSGDKLMTATSWTVPLKFWRKLCKNAKPTLYFRVDGVDMDAAKGDPLRKLSSPTVTVAVQK